MEEKQQTTVINADPEESGERRGIETQDEQRAKEKKQRSKKITLFLLIVLLLSGTASAISLLGYQRYNTIYHNDLSLAQLGVQHLHNAAAFLETLPKKPLDSSVVAHAQHEFTGAANDFSQVDNSLTSIPGIMTLSPVYGSRLSAALRLVPLALEVTQAGIASCTILNTLLTRFHDPLNTHASGLTMVDINVITKNFQQIKGIFKLALEQVNQLQPGDLQFDPRLGTLLATFHKYLPTLQVLLSDADGLVAALPALLGVGTPAHYLVEVLDSTELRPTGGFIGNFGIATLAGGRLTDAHITDVYLLDRAFTATKGHVIPYPAGYTWFSQPLAPASWSFRDSNLEPDFPTSAQFGEMNYLREGGNVPLQGVISITPAFIQHMLDITGPIYVPEYHEMVTAQNLIDRIHYHQLGLGREGNDVPASDGHSSVRKHFTELLAEQFMARVHQLSSQALPSFLQLVISSLHSKDMEIYLNASKPEDLLKQLHVASTVQSAVNDNLFVVDTNIARDKANPFITSTLNDQVTIDAKGNATHNTTLRYVWDASGDVYGSNLYRDYVRIYMPPNSLLTRQSGWQPFGTSMAYGRKVIAGSFTFLYHQSVVIHLTWIVPHAATKDAQGWHYQYEIQRQAGASWNLHVAVTLPSCRIVNKTPGGLFSDNKKLATLNQPLNEDLSIGLDYTCS